MEEPVIYPLFNPGSWSEAWANNLFRTKAIGGIVAFIAILLFLPYFFAIIEARQGIVLNDWLLPWIPARDFSVTIFIFVWSTSLLIIIRCIQQPAIFLRFIYLLIILTLTRIATISLFPLDPPAGLIHLKDPLTSLTYGGTEIFITKDLFFSGHTSNLFLMYFCLQKKRDKQFAILATVAVAILVLVQHVHYSIDVLMAVVFTYLLVKATEKFSFFSIGLILKAENYESTRQF